MLLKTSLKTPLKMPMKTNWVFYVASRYIFKGRSGSPVLAVLGIATGVLALIVIIAVMNGFQLGFIESILEISSYHLRLEAFSPDKADLLKDTMLEFSGVKTAVPFKEYQALARGRRSGQQAVIVRGLNENIYNIDKTMMGRLDFEEGFFDISDNRYILLGAELARRLNLGVGDEVTVYSITGILSADDENSGLDSFEITGIFRTGFYEYDLSWAFVNINSNSFIVNESDLKLGVKLVNRFQDRYLLEQAKKKLLPMAEFEGIKLSSWRDYNRSFFGALRTEKLFMFILVGLIFIVVGLNIFQAQRRSVLQRREEIGLLRAVGGTQNAARFVFVLDGAIIGLTGAAIGLVLGLAIALNIAWFFSFIENIVNSFIGLLNKIAGFLGAGLAGDFAVFSPAIFYIKEIPSRILPYEVIIIFLFGFLSALVAAWFASRKIIKIQPAEVLRYE
ncbi:MAG: ABC transporter permease [Treponema sp.]|jgi:lipoprotein-releasing system permease protein|nr:ABC transporter permease [Treponema sp.]